MIKKILTNTLAVFLVVALLLANAVVLFPTKVAAATSSVKTLQDNDYFVISPAEIWRNNKRSSYISEDWEVNVKNDGFRNGLNIHMWKSGTDSKFRVSDMKNGSFRIKIGNGKFWDVKDRKKNTGANIHVWSGDTSNPAQRFYLVDDKDGDPETFYIKNQNSNKYLAPEGYENGTNWNKSNGTCIVQSDIDFQWRIRILSRIEADAVKYFTNDDYFVVSPAEMWFNDVRRIVPSAEWEVNVDGGGNWDGKDLHMWKFGTDSKFRIRDLYSNNTFRVQVTDYQETKEGKYWDVDGRSVSSGANIHVWSGDSSNTAQRFFLMEDNDGDPETFYIRNLNSGKYLVPQGYFANINGVIVKGKNWNQTEDGNGIKIVQSSSAFRWRVNVLNREVPKTDGYTNWMTSLSDDTYLSQLSIPGTHDACTANVEGSQISSTNIVACQKYFIDEQLIAGVRAFDLRTNENDDSNTFVMIHGKTYTVCHNPGRGGSGSVNMTLISVFEELMSFLDDHPGETIVVSLKIDGDNDKNIVRNLARLLLQNYIRNEYKRNYFYQWSKSDTNWTTLISPQLKDVRGKIVMFSRVDFSDDVLCSNPDDSDKDNSTALAKGDSRFLRSFTGPDLSKWDIIYDNTKLYPQVITSTSSDVKTWVQDDWRADGSRKALQFFNTIDLINSELYAPGAYPGIKDFVFNYTSMTLSSISTLTPLLNSEIMNSLIFHDIKFSDNTERVGIVMMDFVNKALAARVIEHNSIFNHSGRTNVSSSSQNAEPTVKLMSLTQDQPKLLASEHEIVWPAAAMVTYGYVLDEATLYFEDSDKQSTVAGFFYFENGTDILTVSEDDGKAQTLIFESYDGTVKESIQIPVTVIPRHLPISVGNYQIEYGEKFDITQTAFPSAGGYFLPSDQEKLNMVIAAAGLHHKAVDNDSNDIIITSETKPCSGIIQLTADNPGEVKHPNYDTSVENGVWTILPRTINVNWSHNDKAWEASIDNIINGDDVSVIVSANTDGTTATLVLDGEDAEAYRIAEADMISPVWSNNPKTSDSSLYTILYILGILGLGACGYVTYKKIKVKE